MELLLVWGIFLLILSGLVIGYAYYDKKVRDLEEEIKAYESYDITEEDSP